GATLRRAEGWGGRGPGVALARLPRAGGTALAPPEPRAGPTAAATNAWRSGDGPRRARGRRGDRALHGRRRGGDDRPRGPAVAVAGARGRLVLGQRAYRV